VVVTLIGLEPELYSVELWHSLFLNGSNPAQVKISISVGNILDTEIDKQ